MNYLKLTELKKLPNNPRTIKEKDFKKLVDSIKKFGVIKWRPFLVSNRTGENIILGGNQRYEACKKLGINEVPVYIFDNLTEEEEKEIIIRDNINNGEWDFDLLANEFEPLQLEERWLDLPDVTDIEEIEDPDVPFSGELKETSQYVVLYFDNEIDWLTAKEKFNLETVKCNDSKKWYDRKWTNRLINWNFILDKIKD